MTRAGRLSPVELVGPASRMGRDERVAYLDRECGGDVALRGEVESLLGFLKSDEEFLERGPLTAPIIRPDLLPGDMLLPGAVVGRYRIERVLGRGGMGVVYLAEQENPRRQVALKVVRTEIASPAILRRFQREAQVMGRLQHPGIAQIFDAGAAEVGGTPYLAIEFVRGIPLSRHARERGPSIRQRLEVVALVCDAVQHAHDRGLIHRDLKPGNILVDDQGRPKILDFGVARAAEPDGGTMATDAGQLVGTLAYMSPEQVGPDPARVGIRSDVYALGVILYEVLAGRLPLAVRNDALPEAVRTIQETEPARLGSIDRALRGDVETIVFKALEKDPDRRYQSAAELGADIRRWLAGEPIAARQDSALYMVQKRLRRYRWAVGTAAVFVVVVTGLAVRSVLQASAMRALALRERAASATAQQAATRAQAAEQARARELWASDVERGRLLSRTGDSGEAEGLLWRAMVQDPGSDHVLWAMREHYANAPCLSTFRVDATAVRALAFDTSGDSAYILGWEGCAHVWDLGQGKLRSTFAVPEFPLSCAVYPGGWLVASSRGAPISLWEPWTGRRIGELKETTPESYLAVSPDGLVAASGSLDGRVRLWSLPQFACLDTFEAHAAAVAALEFSPDGKLLATGGRDRAVRLWDVRTRQCLGETTGHSGWVTDVSFSRDGTRVVCGAWGWGARVWDLSDNSIRPVADDIGLARMAAFLRDDALLAVMGEWGISLYDGRTLAYVKDLGNHGETVTRIAVSRDGNRLLSISRDSLVKLWDFTPDGPATWLCAGRAHAVLNIGAPSADGRRIATVSSTGGVELWDASGKFIHWLPGPGEMGQYDVAFNAAGTLVAAAANDGTVRVWDAERPGEPRVLKGHRGIVNCVRFAPSGDLLASSGDDGKVRLWDAATGACERVLSGSGRLHRVRFAMGGETVLASGSKLVEAWETRTGKPLPQPALGDTDVFSLDTSPDGRLMAVSYRRRAIGLFDIATGSHIADLTGHTELPWNMAFSPDGRLLLSSTPAGSIKLWDLRSRRCLASFRDDANGWLLPVAFVPGTNSVLIGHQHRGVSMWDLAYYDRHIRGNAQAQLARLSAELGEPAVAPAREWVRTLRP